MTPHRCPIAAAAIALLMPALLAAQHPDVAEWSVLTAGNYRVAPNVHYVTVDGWEGRLDLYAPARGDEPAPTVIFFHGGGWIRGTKEGPILHLLPYLEMGWAVVNVAYRVASVAPAPAAIQDARCAVRWVFDNAAQFGLDTTRVVTTGHSAGGHLALMAALLPASADRTPNCPGEHALRVAAVVNWYGITDVSDLLDGPHRQDFATTWVGDGTGRHEIARSASPLHHVSLAAPPVITIHGDVDPTVPYQHAVRLHRALSLAGVPNRLVTLPGVGHGGAGPAQLLDAYAAIRSFLEAQDIRRSLPTRHVR